MISIAKLAVLLAAPAAIHGLVFKAVSRCTNSLNPPAGGTAGGFCDPPGLIAYADDGSRLTFNGGQMTAKLTEGANGCYVTNGDYNGAPIGVDASEGHYGGGLLNFDSCGIAKGVSPDACHARINGKDGPKSTKTNCNDCSADGFFAYCTCCAVTF